jgi:2-keto-4-pentenoate hydratase
MQAALAVDEPDFGVLFADMLVEDGATVPLARLLQPKVEAEIAVVLGADLRGPDVTVPQALAAIEGVLPSIEIIDSRIADWRIALEDTVADNASAGLFVLGDRVTAPDGLDLAMLGMALWRNGELAGTGAGAAVLGHPARCVAWLANKLAAFGEELSAGDVVLPGALHVAIEVRPGDVVRADFARLGSVRVRFGREDA